MRATVLFIVHVLVLIYAASASGDVLKRLKFGHSVDSSRCENKRCCQFRENVHYDNGEVNINCTSLSIQKCALNDEICEWDCGMNLSHKRKKHRGKFMGFKSRNGRKQRVINSKPPIPKTVDDVIAGNKFIQYGVECGEMYEFTLSPGRAKAVLDAYQDIMISTTRNYSNMYTNLTKTKRRLAVIGTDDRVEVGAAYTDDYPYYNVGPLISLSSSGQQYQCTATLVAPRVLLTAAHCVYNTNTDQFVEAIGDWYFFPNAVSINDINNNNVYSIASVQVSQNYINFPSWSFTYDYAFLELESSVWIPDNNYAFYDYDNDDGDQYFYIIGYPGDKDLETRWQSSCLFNHNTQTLYGSSGVGCDVYEGMSGAAVFNSDGTIYGTFTGEGPSGDPVWVTRMDAVEYNALSQFVGNSYYS